MPLFNPPTTAPSLEMFLEVMFWLIAAIAFFLIIRWFVLWYWKIDKAVIALARIAYQLQRMNKILEKRNKLFRSEKDRAQQKNQVQD